MEEKVSNIRWFGMALQALIVLSDQKGHCPSGRIAEQIDSQSAFLRKILTHLVKANLIQAKEGRDGGYSLVKEPRDITLAEVYDAINANPFTKDFICVESKECLASTTKDVLSDLRDEMESWIIDGLKTKTVADLLIK